MLAISTYLKNQTLTQLTEGFVNESLKNFMDRITDGGSEKRHRKCKFFKSFFPSEFFVRGFYRCRDCRCFSSFAKNNCIIKDMRLFQLHLNKIHDWFCLNTDQFFITFLLDDASISALNAKNNQMLPFAVVGSMDEVKIGNRMVRARQYPWGTVQVSQSRKWSQIILCRKKLKILKGWKRSSLWFRPFTGNAFANKFGRPPFFDAH